MLTSIEICAGAGGQALGLELAGFTHTLLVEYEQDYCNCLRNNRPNWDVRCMDVRNFDGKPYKDKIDLLAGGVPCPPFSIAGKQLGNKDERDLFPEMLRLVDEIKPRAVMIENVRGLLDSKFENYRNSIINKLDTINYNVHVALLNASDYGVPQLRPRVVIVGIRKDIEDTFTFPKAKPQITPTVGECLYDIMASNGWYGVDKWKNTANKIAPTIVGGSKKHGGPDLGPTRARNAWAELCVDGKGVADSAPAENFQGIPRLTPRMIARIQGFPDDWDFGKRKTLACRMIGNAFPPPVAREVALQIATVLNKKNRLGNEKSNISRAHIIPSLFD
ncbi:MAG: DNA cytosine methyltransferase [Bacteroides sp.]|nr:DNA cytosine methyltransferase [Bacteroides sp.]